MNMNWKKISKEEPPEREEFYLVTVTAIGELYSDTYTQEAFYDKNGIWKDPDYGQDRVLTIEGVTHWSEMPEPANE